MTYWIIITNGIVIRNVFFFLFQDKLKYCLIELFTRWIYFIWRKIAAHKLDRQTVNHAHVILLTSIFAFAELLPNILMSDFNEPFFLWIPAHFFFVFVVWYLIPRIRFELGQQKEFLPHYIINKKPSNAFEPLCNWMVWYGYNIFFFFDRMEPMS